jgi:hypothetical protein
MVVQALHPTADLRQGSCVIIKGLEKFPEFNDQRGVCLQFSGETQCWHIRLESGGETQIKPENLETIEGSIVCKDMGQVAFPIGGAVEYYSASRNQWIPAVVQGIDGNRYSLDINPNALTSPSKLRARSEAVVRPEAEAAFPIGSAVDYFSASRNQWIPAVVQSFDGKNYRLDINPNAATPPSKLRTRAEAAPQTVTVTIVRDANGSAGFTFDLEDLSIDEVSNEDLVGLLHPDDIIVAVNNVPVWVQDELLRCTRGAPKFELTVHREALDFRSQAAGSSMSSSRNSDSYRSSTLPSAGIGSAFRPPTSSSAAYHSSSLPAASIESAFGPPPPLNPSVRSSKGSFATKPIAVVGSEGAPMLLRHTRCSQHDH